MRIAAKRKEIIKFRQLDLIQCFEIFILTCHTKHSFRTFPFAATVELKNVLTSIADELDVLEHF